MQTKILSVDRGVVGVTMWTDTVNVLAKDRRHQSWRKRLAWTIINSLPEDLNSSGESSPVCFF